MEYHNPKNSDEPKFYGDIIIGIIILAMFLTTLILCIYR